VALKLQAAAAGRCDRVYKLGDVVSEVLSRRHDDQRCDRIATGLWELDQLTGGLRVGGTTIVAGKPGMGKSMLLKQLARNIAGAGIPVGIISIEETRHKIAENLLSLESRVCNNRIAFSTATPQEWDEIENAGKKLATLPIFTVDSAATISAVTAMAHLLAAEHGCRVIMVDHVHIIDAEPEKNATREREVSKISGALKVAWKTLGVAGVEAAQLNRSSGRERPTKDHLRDSGSLAQDGDTIILLHREDYYRRQDWRPGDPMPELDGVLELIVDKNKDGSPGLVSVRIDEATQRIFDAEPEVPEFTPAKQMRFDEPN
jgi:replicative DNA helicase